MTPDIVSFAKTACPDLNENQLRFLKKQESRKETFEIWPRQSGKTRVGKILMLYHLTTTEDVLLYLVGSSYLQAHDIAKSIIETYNTIMPATKIENRNKNCYKIDENFLYYGSSATTNNIANKRGIDHLHLDEYKFFERNFKRDWERIRHISKKITGLSSRN